MGSCKKKIIYTLCMLTLKKNDIIFFVNCIYSFIHFHTIQLLSRGEIQHPFNRVFSLKHKISIVVICITQYQFSPLLNHKVAWTRRLQHLEVIRCISAYICLIKYIHVHKFEIKSQISFIKME